MADRLFTYTIEVPFTITEHGNAFEPGRYNGMVPPLERANRTLLFVIRSANGDQALEALEQAISEAARSKCAEWLCTEKDSKNG